MGLLTQSIEKREGTGGGCHWEWHICSTGQGRSSRWAHDTLGNLRGQATRAVSLVDPRRAFVEQHFIVRIELGGDVSHDLIGGFEGGLAGGGEERQRDNHDHEQGKNPDDQILGRQAFGQLNHGLQELFGTHQRPLPNQDEACLTSWVILTSASPSLSIKPACTPCTTM